MIMLIYPPVAKPSEPPAGLARLAGALAGVRHSVIDLNIEAQLWLLGTSAAGRTDTWSLRAHRNALRNIDALRTPATYRNVDRYSRAVADLGRALDSSSEAIAAGATLGLADYQHLTLSPVRSHDLMTAAERPELNPYYAFFSTRLSRAIAEEQPAIIGLSLNYLSQALSAFAIAGFIRKQYPGVKLIIGGGLVTSWMSAPRWRSPFDGLFDRMVAGAGEHELAAMAGVSLPTHITPDYTGLRRDSYLSPGAILPYSASSGCWWSKCGFCPELAEQSGYRQVAPEAVIDDLGALGEGYRLLHLLDNAVSPALMRRLMASPPGLPWYGFARVSPELGDDEYCAALRRSGCVLIKLGLESGHQGVLDRMNKGIDLEDASRALRALARAGIATYVYLLFGTPPEAEDEARRTLEFARAHAGDIGFLNLAIFNMPIASFEAAQLATGSFYEGDLSLYTEFAHPRGWDRMRVRRFIEGEFKRDPDIAKILRRTPPVFTSNHAAFFFGHGFPRLK